MSVLAIPKVLEYFEKIVPTLYENGYFSYEEDARKYVKDLYDDIKNSLFTRLHRPAPKYFDKYGKNMKYAAFKKTNEQHGTYFLRHTIKMAKRYCWFDTSQTTTLWHNIYS